MTLRIRRSRAARRASGEQSGPARTRRSALHGEIAARLRQMILEGELRPGERIPELQFCATFGISRTPLREALKVLATEGLVESRPNRGSVVARVQADEIAAIFEVMSALERLAGELVCARISNTEIAELDRLHEELIVLHGKGDRSAYFRKNQQIHERIVALTENPVLIATYGNFAGKIHRARYMANYDRIRWDESVREHEGIMRALRARNPDLLAQRLSEHSTRTGRVVIAQLRKQQDEAEEARFGT
jgi:DNA-binding GntR family transcriptional regulator